jgi:NADP-dependent 3-hydroxy acid dehydrogenase YdfG
LKGSGGEALAAVTDTTKADQVLKLVDAAIETAVRVISEDLRQEVKPYDIRTTVISPGAVATELPSSATEPDVADHLRRLYPDYAIPADSLARAVAMSQP